MTDYLVLRARAEAATGGGRWQVGSDRAQVWPRGEGHMICNCGDGPGAVVDAAYIEAADPETVLALLDDLESLQTVTFSGVDNRSTDEDVLCPLGHARTMGWEVRHGDGWTPADRVDGDGLTWISARPPEPSNPCPQCGEKRDTEPNTRLFTHRTSGLPSCDRGHR